MNVNALVRVPRFKYSDDARKKWVSTVYPLSGYFLELIKHLPWKELGLKYSIFGGAAYELYNRQFYSLTKDHGFDLHTYADPTADIDVSIATTENESALGYSDILFNHVVRELRLRMPIFRKHLFNEDINEHPALESQYGTRTYNHEYVDFFLVTINTSINSIRIRISLEVAEHTDHCVELILESRVSKQSRECPVNHIPTRNLLDEVLGSFGRYFLLLNMYREGNESPDTLTVHIRNNLQRIIYGIKLISLLYKIGSPCVDGSLDEIKDNLELMTYRRELRNIPKELTDEIEQVRDEIQPIVDAIEVKGGGIRVKRRSRKGTRRKSRRKSRR
jgi:hypothetical protein